MRKPTIVFGVGINDADYSFFKQEKVDGKWKMVWTCPVYRTWKHMLERCYDPKYHAKYPSYIECEVCDEWKTFSNFRNWMILQDYEGKVLDKDLLNIDNKVYQPNSCLFVHHKINGFVTDAKRNRGKYMLGVSIRKNGKFMATCSNPFKGVNENLGYFLTELEAHLAWKVRKHEHACALAESEYCNDERLADALRNRYL